MYKSGEETWSGGKGEVVLTTPANRKKMKVKGTEKKGTKQTVDS